MTTRYDAIEIGGTDTAQPLAVAARIATIERAVSLVDKRVIDCGCGAGGYVQALLERGVDAYGVEYEADKVAAYRRTAREPHRVRVGNLAALTEATASFDVALLNEVLEHVPDEHAALREVARILRPGGTLVVFSPNRFHPFETHGVIRKKTGARLSLARTLFVPYLPVPLGKRVFEYPARNYWPHQLRGLVRDAGFDIVSTDYLWQTFENISGTQPGWVTRLVPVLRTIAEVAARMPVVRSLGVSQVIVATRP